MPYRFIENVAVADVAFEATGKNLNDLFEACALAVTHTMVKDPKQIKKRISKKITVEAEEPEKLLLDFLGELLFYKDAERLLFSDFKVKITSKNGKFLVDCAAKGEEINMKKHELLVDVKAITWHKFEVKETPKGWKAFVILDV